MKLTRRTLAITLPITLLIFLWVTMRTHSAYASEVAINAESMVAFGFPLSWHAANAETSMGTLVGVVPLALDFAVYFVGVFLVTHRARHHIEQRSKVTVGRASAVLWLAALLSVATSVFLIGTDVRVQAMAVDSYFDDRAVRVHSLAFGLQPTRK